MKRTMLVLVAGIFLVLGGVAFGQASHLITIDVNAFAVVALNPGADVTLLINGAGLTAGDSVINATHNTNWLQYTFVSTAADSGFMTVQLTGGAAIPAWLTLEVTVAADAGSGNGDTGSGAATVPLTFGMGATNLITSISGCYTGSVASTDGRQLTYNLEIDPAQIGSATNIAAIGPYTVTYTVTP